MAWFLTKPLLLRPNIKLIPMKMTLGAQNMPFHRILLIFTLVLMCLFSCKKDIPTNITVLGGEARVKIINASQGTTDLDFYLNSNKINDKALAYGESSGYIKVQSGTKNASFIGSGNQDVTAELNLVPSFSYTSFYLEDKTGKGEILTLEDDLGATEVGMARIRFVNLGPNFTNAINIITTGNTLLVNSLAFKEKSMYFAIDPTIDLGFSVLGAGGPKIIRGAEFEAGKIYTIWVGGSSNSSLSINKITYN